MTTQTLPPGTERLGNLEGQMTQINERLRDMNTNIINGRTETNARLDAHGRKIEDVRREIRYLFVVLIVGVIGTIIASVATPILTA